MLTFKVEFKSVPFLPLYFNCPVFTLDDYTTEDCQLEEKDCYFENRLIFPNKDTKIGFTSSEKMKKFFLWPTLCALSIKSKRKRNAGNEVIYLQNTSHYMQNKTFLCFTVMVCLAIG